MPTYDYECQKCKATFDVVQKITEPALTDCVNCGETNSLKRLISASLFVLKDGGWYADGYASRRTQNDGE